MQLMDPEGAVALVVAALAGAVLVLLAGADAAVPFAAPLRFA